MLSQVRIDSPAPASLQPNVPALIGVSCPSRNFCLAVDAEGRSMELDGGQWTQPRQFAKSGEVLDAVSCATPTFCVAGSETGDIYQFNGSNWSTAQDILPQDANANASYEPGPALVTVTCTSIRFCFAIDTSGSYSIFGGKTWSPLLNMPAQDNGFVGDVSCAVGPTCVVIMGSGKMFMYRYHKKVWSRVPRLGNLATFNTGAGYNLVACTGPSFCVALNKNGDTVEYNGTRWTNPVRVDPHSRWRGFSYLDSVGCSSRSLCITADLAGYITS